MRRTGKPPVTRNPASVPPSRILGAALGLAVLWLVLGVFAPAPRPPPLVQEPPAPKVLLFVATPPGIPGAYVALVEEDGSQTTHVVNEAFEVRMAGKVAWTVHAPGHRSLSGTLMFHHGPSDPIRVEVELTPVTPGRAR